MIDDYCRLALAPRPDTGIGVGDERREHHARDQENRHTQHHHIDDTTHLIDHDGALTTKATIARPARGAIPRSPLGARRSPTRAWLSAASRRRATVHRVPRPARG